MDPAEVIEPVRPLIVVKPRKGLFQLDLQELWHYRELLYFLVWRDVLIRYKQTVIGVSWAVLQPLITMMIFTVIFGKLVKISTGGIPYPVFAFAALLPWNFFSQALSRSGTSLVGNSHLISKIYFPRLLIPLSSSIAPVIDLFISFLLLLVLMPLYGIAPSWGLLFLPFFVVLALVTTLSAGLWLTTLNVKYRDVGYVIPFLIQIWMYASPVVYPLAMVPEKWRLLYSLNPMVGIIEGFRWAITGSGHLDAMALITCTAVVSLLLAGGIVYFKNMEQTFADVI